MSVPLASRLPAPAATGSFRPTLSVVANPEDRPIAMTAVPRQSRIEGHPDQRALVRVLVLARSPAVRAGLGALLTTDESIVMAAAPGGRGDGFGTNGPAPDDLDAIDAVVIDLPSFAPTGLDDVAERYPATPLVVLGGDPAGSMAGDVAMGYLSSEADSASLTAAVHAVVAGLTVVEPALVGRLGARGGPAVPPDGAGETLTPREREVLQLVAEGLPNKTIARELGISEHTAKFHVGSLLAKLDAGSRTEAVTTATRRGLLTV